MQLLQIVVLIYLLATDVLPVMKRISSILAELKTLPKETSMGTYWIIANLLLWPYLRA